MRAKGQGMRSKKLNYNFFAKGWRAGGATGRLMPDHKLGMNRGIASCRQRRAGQGARDAVGLHSMRDAAGGRSANVGGSSKTSREAAIRGLENTTHEQRAEELCLFSLAWRRPRRAGDNSPAV